MLAYSEDCLLFLFIGHMPVKRTSLPREFVKHCRSKMTCKKVCASFLLYGASPHKRTNLFVSLCTRLMYAWKYFKKTLKECADSRGIVCVIFCDYNGVNNYKV